MTIRRTILRSIIGIMVAVLAEEIMDTDKVGRSIGQMLRVRNHRYRENKNCLPE
ncbi:MAG TPA: hypothetical protein VIW07_08760 [Candidatus Udaeobacter sp.]|jgi:hypothetical protein